MSKAEVQSHVSGRGIETRGGLIEGERAEREGVGHLG